jgi:1-acyl-sn-glycerol-3-phosphate acyltransferase
MCILCVPILFLPQKMLMATVLFYLNVIYFLERVILGLDYEVRGLENLPTDRAYIVAAKHQSTYETFKLHFLFGDPSIILKKELIQIPIWGTFLNRLGPIAIDRSNRKEALKQMGEGAQKIADENKRALIIFPQGTRVKASATAQDKPYKYGIVRIAEDTKMPIIPLALNTGYFWPRGSWMKRPGKVVFSILPAIDPQDVASENMLGTLTDSIETESIKLYNEATATGGRNHNA